MIINFFSTDDGVELACLELPRVPMKDEFVAIDGRVQRVRSVVWTVKKNKLVAIQVLVRNLQPNEGMM